MATSTTNIARGQLRQEVVLGRLRGNDVIITVDWLRALNARFDQILAPTTTPTTPTVDSADHSLLLALRADLTALIVRVDTLENQSADYERRLRALEGGYQA